MPPLEFELRLAPAACAALCVVRRGALLAEAHDAGVAVGKLGRPEAFRPVSAVELGRLGPHLDAAPREKGQRMRSNGGA